MGAPDRACPDYPNECMHPWAHARTYAEVKATQTKEIEMPEMTDEYDWDRAQRIRDELDTAKPGDVFAYQQPNGNRVLLVVARFEPTGIAGSTAVTG